MSLHIKFQHITKSFGSVQVLQGVSLNLPAYHTYGLLGENGAGKSTLMKILAGFETATSGQIKVNGQAVQFHSSRDAIKQGIVLIHQEFNLAEDLSITANLFLGRELKKGFFLDNAAMDSEAKRVLALVGLTAEVATPVKKLIVAEKQLLEIARALLSDAKLLIMDEPTATLTPNETERLFELMRQLREQGVTLIYISHKLDEVERVTDQIIVMRDGVVVTQQPTQHLTRQQMAQWMVGRELADLYPAKCLVQPQGEPAIEVTHLTVPGWAEQISFSAYTGEIVGFAGLVGAGRTELFEGILGLRPLSSGSIKLLGKIVKLTSPQQAVAAGLTYLSEDRKGKGLHIQMGLMENLTLMDLKRYATPLLHPTQEMQALKQASQTYGIRTGTLALKAASLSGGNQQKLALAKVLHPEPKVVVLDEPTRGVDIGAKRDIYQLIQQLAQQGLCVLVISSELVELIGLCHRVAVLRQGKLTAMLDATQLTEKELIAYATGTR